MGPGLQVEIHRAAEVDWACKVVAGRPPRERAAPGLVDSGNSVPERLRVVGVAVGHAEVREPERSLGNDGLGGSVVGIHGTGIRKGKGGGQ